MSAADFAWAKTVDLKSPSIPIERRFLTAMVLQQHGLLPKKEGHGG